MEMRLIPGDPEKPSTSPVSFKKLFERLPEPVYAIDHRGRIVAWNMLLTEMTGITEEFILGQDIREVMTPLAELPRPFAIHTLVLRDPDGLNGYIIMNQTDTSITGKRSVHLDDLQERIFFEKNQLIHDDDGKVEYGIVIIRDLTKRSLCIGKKHKDREDLERISECLLSFGSGFEENIRSILRTVKDRYGGSCALYYSGINKGLIREGSTVDKVVPVSQFLFQRSRSILDQVTGSDNTAWILMIEPVPYGDSGRMFLYIPAENGAPDNSPFFLRLLAHAIATEERRAEADRKIEADEERYRALFDHAPVAIFEEDYSEVFHKLKTFQLYVSDPYSHLNLPYGFFSSLIEKVRIIGMNSEAKSLVRNQNGEYLNNMEIFRRSEHGKDLFIQACNAIISGETIITGTDRIWLSDGNPRDIIMKWSVPPDENKTYDRVLVSIVDISEQKKAEFTLINANRKLQTMTTITRHDIANIMTAIIGYLEVIRDEGNSDICREMIEKAITMSNLAGNFIKFTKVYGEIGSMEPSWQDLTSVIDSGISTDQFPNFQVTISIPHVEIFADTMFSRIFYTLIENTARHGKYVSSVFIYAFEQNNSLHIVYEDNGAGIASDDKNHIFERGYGKNTGWGLFLAREILSYTGIGIHEEGVPGKGVKFVISVPRQSYRIRQSCEIF